MVIDKTFHYRNTFHSVCFIKKRETDLQFAVCTQGITMSHYPEGKKSQETEGDECSSQENTFVKAQNEAQFMERLTKQATKMDEDALINQIKLRHIEPVSTKNLLRESTYPTFREIDETLQLFAEKWPQKDIHKLVRMLYNNLVENRSQVSSQSSRTKEKNAPRHWLEMNPDQIQKYMNTPRKFRLKNPIRIKKIITKQDQELAKQRHVVARSFCNRGYGINSLKEELLQQPSSIVIKRKKYRNFVRAICVSTYRLIEYFLINECKRSIKPINKYEINALQQVLFNCRFNLKEEQLLTFIKFVKMSEHLGSVAISEDAAMKLYSELQAFIRARVGPKHLDKDLVRNSWGKYRRKKFEAEYNKHYKEDFQRFMTMEVKEEMLRLYKTYHTPQKLRQYYQKTYPENKNLFKTSEVHLKMNQMLRIAFKKFLFLCKKYERYGLQELLYNDKRDSKLIYNHSEGLTIRFQLIDLYFDSETDIIPRLQRVSVDLNEYLTTKINERLNYTIENIQPIGPVTKKLEYNINLSRAKNAEGRYRSTEEVILKGKERDYNHFVNISNGKNIHYYRACDQPLQQNQQNKQGEVKVQENTNEQRMNGVKIQEDDYTRRPEGTVKKSRKYKGMGLQHFEQLISIDKKLIKRLQIQVKEPVYKISQYQNQIKEYMERIGLDVHNLIIERHN